MNGNDTSRTDEFCIMDSKPILTYAGDTALFLSLESTLAQALPQDPSEWRRSYGRAVKSVHVEATFIPFSKDILPKGGNWHLIRQPILHIYWTECVDVDVYKTSVRDDMESWLKTLGQYNIQDWMIVIVETYDVKKSNKLLPRTTVLDKIRSDFATKHADRCLSVINPIRSESRSAESWRGLLVRVRHLVLCAYNRTLIRFEEVIRDQRERRNELGWGFCQYFLLQEEMAFVLEMLGLYDEALVQYDELDALFTQFVLNSNVGETPTWLSSFQGPFNNWPGIVLCQTVNQTQRILLKECQASLLQFRSYLFSRQCAMLLLTFKPWEIAQRSLPFLHNCIKELDILEIAASPGAIACWVFLCCLEVLHTCDRFNDSLQVQEYSRYTASLWAYARDKLRELGELCGLMPGCDPTSEQLHLVVGLSAGMGDSQGSDKQPTPTDKLKEALSSKEAFKKHYLELAELAVGTYKHVGRIRSARLIGRDLAAFYIRLGDMQTAAAFLSDALKTYEDENWRFLVVQTQQELADCYKRMGDRERLIKMCAAIASAQELSPSIKNVFFDQMLAELQLLNAETAFTAPLTDAMNLTSVEVLVGDRVLIEGSEVEVAVEVESLLPREVTCSRVSLSVEELREAKAVPGVPAPRPHEERKHSTGGRRHHGNTPIKENEHRQHHRCSNEDMKPANPVLSRLHMVEHLDYKQDKSLNAASMVSKNPKQFLRRTDSHGKYRKISTTSRCDFTNAFSTENIVVKPGKNKLLLKTKAQEKGVYRLGQLSVVLQGNLELLSSIVCPRVSFEVTQEPSSVMLNKGERDLLSGLEQEMVLTVTTGSYSIKENVFLKLRTSRGLQMRVKSSDEPLSRELQVALPQSEAFQTLSVLLTVLADLPPKKDSSMIEHKVSLQCPWTTEEKTITLHFQPPFMSSFRLHTAGTKKFVQIVVAGLNVQLLELREPSLTLLNNQDVKLVSLNPSNGQKQLVRHNMNVSYMWQLDVGSIEDMPSIKTEFTILYSPIIDVNRLVSDGNPRSYKCNFDVTEYKTLFVVKSRVEPMKGNEFCRASTMCHMQLHVQRVNPSSHSSLMYEVLADQTMWAVCGRTAGVISLESADKQNVTLDVMPLIGGFLPLPLVRLSKYIPAEQKAQGKDGNRKADMSCATHPRLEPFSPGQVYNSSKAQQVHVLPPSSGSTSGDPSLP